MDVFQPPPTLCMLTLVPLGDRLTDLSCGDVRGGFCCRRPRKRRAAGPRGGLKSLRILALQYN